MLQMFRGQMWFGPDVKACAAFRPDSRRTAGSPGNCYLLHDPLQVTFLVAVQVPVRRVAVRVDIGNKTGGMEDEDQQKSAVHPGLIDLRLTVVEGSQLWAEVMTWLR